MENKKKCPKCGTECYRNVFGELICPNCGNVKGITKIQDFSNKKIEDFMI